MTLAGKVAVVTGSNSGIGLGIAEELARAGADVVLNSFTDRPEDHALADRLAGEHRVRCIRQVLLERQPSKQFATVEQIGGCVVFLCSPAAEQITGTTLSVDGGWTAL